MLHSEQLNVVSVSVLDWLGCVLNVVCVAVCLDVAFLHYGVLALGFTLAEKGKF